jgi:uncharacterized membrane protein YhaH (DUF805 family)
MGMTEAVKSCFSKFVTFSGRAARSELWWFVLFSFVGSIILDILDAAVLGAAGGGVGILGGIWSLVLILPSISVAVRRLHDTDRSGWWYWLFLVPFVGFIVLIVWFATKGTDGSNRFGNDPLSGVADDDDDGFYEKSSVPTVDRD